MAPRALDILGGAPLVVLILTIPVLLALTLTPLLPLSCSGPDMALMVVVPVTDEMIVPD